MARRYFIVLALLLLPSFGCDYVSDLLSDVTESQQPQGSDAVTAVEPAAQSPAAQPPVAPTPTTEIALADGSQPLSICSFNIQFLGNPKDRDHAALAEIMRPYDIVVIQELVAPPCEGMFPDGTPYRPDIESAEFFRAMQSLGFHWLLSEEDTGSGDKIHMNSSATEWWVAFYRPEKVQVARDLPGGFLAADRSNHDDYERVPYAFPFRTVSGGSDFVLISVHLQPGDSRAEQARRAHELQSIAAWIDQWDQHEQDFIILGDMNIKDSSELARSTPPGFVSLNDECRATNTKGDKPYDHVMYSPSHTLEVDRAFDMQVVNLAPTMRSFWNKPAPYPGDPYDHNEFRKYYSDHHPIVFKMRTSLSDDDGPAVVAGRPADPATTIQR